jgi:hypothetical protein
MGKRLLVDRIVGVFCLDGVTHHPPSFRAIGVHLGGLHAVTKLRHCYQQSSTQERPAKEECFQQDSVALCNQIRTIDIEERVEDQLGVLSDKKLREIEKAVQVALDFI